MIVRGVDALGNWMFGKGKNDYKKNRDAVTQNIKTRLKQFLGNCFFALNEGIDWPNLMGGKSPEEVKLAVSTCILNTEGVTGITLLTYSLDESRNLFLQYKVQTVYGEIDDKYQYALGV